MADRSQHGKRQTKQVKHAAAPTIADTDPEDDTAAAPKPPKGFRQAAPPKIPVIAWSLAIGNRSKAAGDWSLALGNDATAADGGLCILEQLFYDDGEIDDMPLEYKPIWLAFFKSPELQLWAMRRREHYTQAQYDRMVRWINRFMGEDVFALSTAAPLATAAPAATTTTQGTPVAEDVDC